jgi:hypothetical protein
VALSVLAQILNHLYAELMGINILEAFEYKKAK